MRLIDADALKDRASEYSLCKTEYEDFCEIIDAEPTAYDVDVVILKIERLRDNGYVSGITNNLHELSAVSALDKAIEIVKAGGKHDK